MLIVDSREKKWDHIRDYLTGRKMTYIIKKLETGDYMNDANPTVIIDRKRNLGEVCSNLCTTDSNRFWREIRRSKQEHIKLIVLVEHGGSIKTVQDVIKWKSKYSKITGSRLMEEMYRVEVAYGIEWMFCNKRQTPKLIIELLGINEDDGS